MEQYYGGLHNHTEYSNLRLRDSINKIDNMLNYAEELGHKVIGFTDHETVSSWIKIEKAMKKHPSLKVIRGNEIYLCRNGLNAQNFNKDNDKYYHFILLAKDLQGAKQIFEISTRAWQRSYMARGMRRVPTYYQDLFDIIGANPGHVIGSTACLGGALPTQILRGTDEDKLDRWINQMVGIFGKENFFLEMQPSKNKEQILVNQKLLEFAQKHNLKYIITTDSHYLKKEDRIVHKAYLNAQNGDREVDDFYATTYMMSTEEIESYMSYSFKDLNIIRAAYHTIDEIAEMCEDYSLLRPLKIPSLHWDAAEPLKYGRTYWINKISWLENFYKSDFNGDHLMCDLIINKLESDERLQNEKCYLEINDNLERTWKSSEANKTHWSAYFLNLRDNIKECWNAGTLVGPARGSGGGFLLLYLLDIIQINPLWEEVKVYPWRFLNPDRVSPLDIDTDIEGGKRDQVLTHFRKVYGEDRVANVATFRTEKSKSAILTAARGLGIDIDIAQYIASLIPADRGLLRTLDQCYYGDDENQPIKQFVIEMNNYPELWKIAHKIEGLICGSGLHAGGVVFVDEPFTESTALMRAPDGTICTQFELHDLEDVGNIKIDLLSVEALDKIHNCLDLLCEQGYIERKPTLKETYESTIGIYKIDRSNDEMWKMVWNHQIQSLFQLEQQSGITGIALTKPHSVGELATLNSVMRLMAPEKGAEQPLELWAKYINNISIWEDEMDNFNLTVEEKEWIKNHPAFTNGICESQEGLMSLVMEERLGGNPLVFADKLRKQLAKKLGKEGFEKLYNEFIENGLSKGCSKNLMDFIWNCLKVQFGYSFCRAHCLAYSLIALQEMNLAYKYPIIFWNCACLISDAGGTEIQEIEEEIFEEVVTYSNEMEEFGEEDKDDDIEDSYEEEDCDGYPAEVCIMKDGKKKKKVANTNYGKIAMAIGKIKSTGVSITPPDINESTFTFSPDIENNTIRYGLNGITRIGEELIKQIIASRPISSIEDLTNKVKINKAQVINLIKAGAFDNLYLDDRVTIMENYIKSISNCKKRITLQNMAKLIEFKLLPDEYEFQCRVFNFNKYLKKLKENNVYYGLDNIAFNFYTKYFDMDMLEPSELSESYFKIKQTRWDKIYQKQMDIVRSFIKKEQQNLLNQLNNHLIALMWDKYCQGSISHWEMEAISCYIHPHELTNINYQDAGIDRFRELSATPQIERYLPIKGKLIPIYKLNRIAGTVLDRNKSKKSITLLTTDGVVTVKIYGVFAQYDKQISERGADGKKHIIEKSMFSRGNKIIITGIRDGDNEFRAKTYKSTPFHHVELITDIHNGMPVIHTRF